jgi:aspartyl-tRNA(Asn)/glutamyl-tRNA(Gln) amidotransferase subunit A
VAAAWSGVIARLGASGVRLSDETITLFDGMMQVNARGGFAPPEALATHHDLLKRRGGDVDPNVRARIERAGAMTAADYVEIFQARQALVRAMADRISFLDALVLPTTPIVAPRIADVDTPETFGRNNMMLLRNTSMVNFFDLCAISLPVPRPGALAVGLMLVGRNGDDARLFRIAAAVEQALTG